MRNKLQFICILSLPLFFSHLPAAAQNIPDFLVNEQAGIDGSAQSTPYIDGDGSGNYVVCWKDKRNGSNFDIYAQIYLSGSTTSGVNFKVCDDGETADQYSPAVAVNENLNFVIAWIDRRNGNQWDIYAQRFSNDGTALGNNFKVNDDPGSEEQEHPSVSIDSFGNFVIVWADKRNGDWDIYAQRFLNDGAALGNNFKINDDAGNSRQYWPTSSGDKNGNFIVSWVDQRNADDHDIYAQRFSADGTALGNNYKVNTDPGGSLQLRPDIAIDGNGDFIIAWEDNRNGHFDIYAQRFLNDGSTLADNFKINDDTPNTSQRNASISSDLTGNFVVCWDDNRNDYYDVYGRRFLNNGIPVGDDFKVNTDTTTSDQCNSVVSVDENWKFRVVWQDHRFGFNGDIFTQSYSNNGATVGENLKVNDDEGNENQKWPSIATDGSGNFVIVWDDDGSSESDIYAQRFSVDGTPLGNNFRVNDDTSINHANNPSVAARLDGSFVITWADFRDANFHRIYAQLYSADGIAMGNNFKVSYLSAAINYGPEVVCKQNGDFIITWGDASEGGLKNDVFRNLLTRQHAKRDPVPAKYAGEPDIWAQQFLCDGTPIGENFRVNENAGFAHQLNPAIAVNTCGNFIITWEDDRNDSWEIFLQRYHSDGTPVGSNFRVEDAIYGDYQLGPSVCMDDAGNFSVTWLDNRNEDLDIYCRRFNSEGNATGKSFRVNDDSGSSYQTSPCISTNQRGHFIITFTDYRNGNADVYAQQYLHDGTPYGYNFRIPDQCELEQSCSRVVLGDNRFYTTWHDNHTGQTGFDIWANAKDWDYWVGIGNSTPVETSPLPCLHQNYPNPFSQSTTIKFDLPEAAKVKIEICNHFGQKIETLLNKPMSPGSHEIEFVAGKLPGGVYLFRIASTSNLNAGEFQQVKRMVVLR